ncbi:hypothetical protein HPB48_013568 [Haemaphysalis longicornis]|uniref:Uncharacterized protein n=1 Tax=Haemaphysalis longicornis TaxID=44386 RepID=A0A9J6GTZ2_HAELO|nr:hypothetical protein HPB48_013568 [Haemaphysalis longicornis]
MRIFDNFLIASDASDCVPDRRKALLLYSLGFKGQRLFHTPPLLSSANTKPGEQSTTGTV